MLDYCHSTNLFEAFIRLPTGKFHISENSPQFVLRYCQHSSHFLEGFIGLPTGQLNALEKPSKFITGPFTRTELGLWLPKSWDFWAPSVELPHHMCAYAMKKSCSWVYSGNPGSANSGELHCINMWYATFSPKLSAIFSPRVLIPFTVKLSPSCVTVKLLYWSTRHCSRSSYCCDVASVHNSFRFPSLSYLRPEITSLLVYTSHMTYNNCVFSADTERTI